MGKKVIVAGFLLSCALALYVLFTRESLRPPIESGAPEPRVSLEEFTLYKYHGHKVEATISGKLALFLDPNVLDLYGSVRGLRHNSEKREYLSAEAASVFFTAQGLAQIMEQGTEISKVEIEDNVNIGVKYSRLITEYAEFLPKSQLLQSKKPVLLKGPGGDFKGENGFRYQLDKEIVTIFGPIEGEMQGATLGHGVK